MLRGPVVVNLLAYDCWHIIMIDYQVLLLEMQNIIIHMKKTNNIIYTF